MVNQSYINGVSRWYPVDAQGNTLDISVWEEAKKAGKKKAEENKSQEASLGAAFENSPMFNGGLLTSRSQLPNTATNIFWKDIQAGKDLYKEGMDEAQAGNALGITKAQQGVNIGANAPTAWLMNAVNHPRTLPEFAVSWAYHMTPEWTPGASKDEKANLDDWFETYLASGGAGTSGGYAPDVSMMGSPFPEIAGYVPDWEAIKKARDIKAPEYKEREYDKLDDIAAGLANFTFDDIGKAVNIMNARTDARKQDVQDVYNKNEEARYSSARQNLATQLAIENLREKQAANAAEIAISRWQAMQPRALGGNKIAWRDAAGNLHFEQVDKQGEARTLGSNEAIAMLAALDEKKLKNLTPEKIVQMAKKQSLLLQDKAAQVPWMQGYILQANEALNSRKEK